jgi:protein TonB
MNEQVFNKFDLDEVIFEKKNKEYGAYKLRKAYKLYLASALWIAIIAFFLGTAGPVIYNKIAPKPEVKIKKRTISITELSEPPSIGEKKEVVEVDAPPPLKSTIAFLPPVIKPDEQVTEEYMPTIEELKNVDPGATTQQGVEGGVDYSLLEVQDAPKVVQEEAEEKAEVFTYVEEMPSFPGGQEELLTFLAENIKYPEIAKRAGVEGKIFVSFVVAKSGKITDIQMVKGIGAGCDEEAIRVVRMMPEWKPGKQNGAPVNVRVSIPIVFKLQ